MTTVRIIFPHQLHEDTRIIKEPACLVEESLFFRQFAFHCRKLTFHRASMKYYHDLLVRRGIQVEYVASTEDRSDIRHLIVDLAARGVRELRFEDPVDDWLNSRITSVCLQTGISGIREPSRLFLNQVEDLNEWFESRKRYFQTDFYIHQRKTRDILLDDTGGPINGKWSFDAENRERWPKGQHAPAVTGANRLAVHQEAEGYVQEKFSRNPGALSGQWDYPVTHAQASEWLEQFLQQRFAGFGRFEDAMVRSEPVLNHSVLTPMLNTGLLTTQQVLERAIDFGKEHQVPFNSVEGFVRQVLGWREFIRAVYVREGRKQRTTNFWGFTRPMPTSFYDGTTGILPVDSVIKKLLSTGYSHHIERLMVLGNFMLLCEIHPDSVYQWFMELYIDAYDWVMVPNVYGMSQFADGGLMCTKPYISGSNYLLKMSDYPADPSWTSTWDALFWRFMHVHRDFLGQHPRLGMLLRTLDKMDAGRRTSLLNTADDFLAGL